MPGDPTAYGARGNFRVRNRQGQFVTGGFGVEWVGLEMIDSMFATFGDRMHAARVETADKLAELIDAYMRTNAPWKDRTGIARNDPEGLKAIAVHEATSSSVYAGYGRRAPYGFFLENYTYGGVNYGIVRKTMERFAADMGAVMKEAI